MYKEIDENEEQKKYTEVVNKITPETLGLKPTNDFAEYAQQTIIDENPDKVKEWVGKGAINIMEAGKRYAAEFDGTYGNIDPAANLNSIEKALHNSGINNAVDERIEKRTKAKEERNKRVNNGTASILDRIGASLDRWGNASYQAQLKGAEQQENSQMPHKNDPNYKYKPVGTDITGRVIYNETDLRKKIDFSEALADSIGKGKALPFISGLVEGSSSKKYRDIAERIRNGEAIRQDELDFVNRYNENLNEEYIRGYTIGGQIGSSILPSLLAFGSEIALGGAVLSRLGLKGAGIAGGTNLGKNLLRSGKVGKKAAKAIAFTSGQLAEGAITAGVTSAVNPSRIFATYQERRLNDEMKITDRGTVIFSEAKESPAKAFIKSLGQVYISYFTENMGALLGSPLKAGGNAIKNVGAQQFAKVIEKNPVLEKLIQRTAPIFAKAYEKLNNLPIKGKSVEWLKGQVKFDGFIEELGEEVLEDILNLTFGTNDEERTLENYVSKIVKSPEEWAVLAGVIALQGTMLSIAGNTLGDYMHSNGVEFENIAKVLTDSTESEKIEYIDEAIKRGDIKINEGAIQDNQGHVSNLKNKYYTQIKNAGIEDTEALQTADLFSQVIATTANKFDMSIEDTDRLMGLNIQSMTDEQAKAQQQADIKVQQENLEKHNQPLYQRKKIRTSPGQISLNFDNVLQMNLFQQKQIFAPQEAGNQPVQLEIKSSYTESDILTTPQTTEQINDVGDSLLGNLKKNKKQYTWAELENMNDLLRSKYIAKKYIVQMPTFQELKEQGLSDRSAAYVLYVYSKINSKPASGYDSLKSQKTYYDFVNEIIEKTIQFAKDNNELITNFSPSQFNNDLFKTIFPNTENKPVNNVFRAYPEYNYKASVVGGNKFVNSLYLDYQSNKDIDKLAKTYSSGSNDNKKITENLTGWQKKFEVSQNYRGWFIADRKSGMIISSTNLPSKEIAEFYAQKIYDYLQANQNSFTVDFSKMRNHIPRRQNNQNVRPEALIEIFGFRGINFGNWTKQSERQDFVNLAYDSLYDLAEILNIPPKALSLGGKLGLAFGAQGRSRAAGHFIPEYNEINLTRKSGAGSLAHEWWHALDFYFGDQSNGKDFSGTPALTLKSQGLLREDIYNALSEIREQMKFAPLTEDELNTKKNIIEERIKRNIEYYANDIKKSFSKSKHSVQINSFIDDILNRVGSIDIKAERDELDKKFVEMLEERRRTFDNLSKLNNLEYQILKLQQVEALAQASKKYTNYYNNAVKLNQIEKGSGNYWTQDTELGARAFASYILDKINQQQYTNHFLVQDEALQHSIDLSALAERIQNQTENKDSIDNKSMIVEWFPADTEERKRIFEAFDRLFNKVQVRNENNNLILYQSINESNNFQDDINNARGFTYQRFNFDGTTKDNLIVLLKGKANKSTLLHEFAHVYLITLNNLARENAKARDLLIKVNKFLNYNGVEYTTAQHEKFANSFVAYVRTGKAPTFGLKRVFENFKKWLNDLYSNLQLSDEIELSQEAKDVFDELLGDMTLEKQKQISLDIIQKAKDNARLRFWEDEKDNRNISQNQLTDRQRRYRDTAYNILWYALSHTKNEEGKQLVKDKRQLYMLLGNDSKVNRKNKGVMSQSEKLKSILAELDDAFSGNDGFLPEWAEFFNDPGVSTQNDEMADSELALMALDVIENKKYLYDAENVYEELSVNDVKIAELELDYIIQKYAEDKTDKSNVVVAFFEWIDNQHPYIHEDLIAKWESKTNEIDRYQALNKFEQAKEDLKLYAATLKGHGDYSWQFAEYARAILKRLDFMTERDKEKIFSKLKEYNSFREVERNLDYVMDYAQTLDDVTLRRNIADTIINEIKHTTPEIKNGTKKTRYDYRTNKLFERLRYLNKLNQEEITDLYDAYVNGEIERRAEQFDENGTISSKVETYFEDIENSFLQFKANGMYYNSAEMLQTLLDKIQNAKFTGKLARDEMDFERQMNQKNWIDNCAKAVETHKGKVGKTEELYSMEANFDSLLSMIFDDKIKNKFSLDDLYAQVDGRVGKDREEVLNKIADAFGFQGVLKGAMLNNKFIEMTNDKFTIKQRYANKYQTDTSGVWNWEDITLSRMEVLYYYIQSKNPTSYAMLTDMGDENTAPKGQFDKFEFDELINKLTDQEKLMGDILQTAAEKYYNDLNKYHIKKHHIDMGKVTCYFPRKSEMKEINELDLFNQYTEKSTNPKFVKMRSAGPSVRIAPANPINVLFNHIQKANTIIIMGDQLDLMNKVFRDNDLKQKIKSVFGDKVYMEFMQHVTENLYSGQTATLSNAEGIISKIMSNVIAAPMLIKPQIGIKQVMGLINYGVGDEHVSTLEWLKAFGKVIKNPKAAIDFMMKDEYLKDRLTRANLNEAMKNQVDNKLFSKMSLLTDYFSLNMRLGDLFNLTLGGRAYIQVLLDKGYTEKQAFELFRRKTISDQQSSIPSTLSNLQRNSKNNPFARLLFAYQNTPHQYFRICANAVIKAKQGKMSKTQAVKTIFIYWWFLPFIFNMAGSLSLITFLTTGDPDEIYNDMLIACLGSITCIPFFGEMARALFSTVTGQEYFGNKDWFTRANESIIKPINKARKGDLTFEDVLKSLEILAQGFGIPLEEIDTQLEAVGDYAQGDIAKGFLKTLGYSRYRAKKLTGEEKE